MCERNSIMRTEGVFSRVCIVMYYLYSCTVAVVHTAVFYHRVQCFRCRLKLSLYIQQLDEWLLAPTLLAESYRSLV